MILSALFEHNLSEELGENALAKKKKKRKETEMINEHKRYINKYKVEVRKRGLAGADSP